MNYLVTYNTAILPISSPVSSEYIYIRKLLIKHALLIWYFHYIVLDIKEVCYGIDYLLD